MIDVLLTGGIGSGKTTVARIFELLKVPVYYADTEAGKLIENNTGLMASITGLLGPKAYVKGKYNRKYVANRVFGNDELLKRLNAIVHPQVAAHYESWKSQNQGEPYVIKEAAVVSKSGTFDKCIFVYASRTERIHRILGRDRQRDKEEIEKIMDKQMGAEDFRAFANFEIDNESQLIVPQVLNINGMLTA